jgi:hypothetical protein
VAQRTQLSGKLVILGILGVALAAAGTSWWFRYSATRRAAAYWGPYVTTLIRDAPTVRLIRLEPTAETKALTLHFQLWSGTQVKATEYYDVSAAPGMTHLRTALLEDHNYVWPPRVSDHSLNWGWMLQFSNEPRVGNIFLLFTNDCTQTALLDSDDHVLSCKPIADGLSSIFAEFTAKLPARQH